MWLLDFLYFDFQVFCHDIGFLRFFANTQMAGRLGGCSRIGKGAKEKLENSGTPREDTLGILMTKVLFSSFVLI
jgi:hypothetical protein